MSAEEREKAFPIFLKSDDNKIRIRFDTNGQLFKNKDFASEFIGGIYDLKLHNIKVDLTFSLKGTNSYEVDWFTEQNCVFDASKIKYGEAIEKHAQWNSVDNIVEAIKEREADKILSRASGNIISETYFNPCGVVSLTVERGIMNYPREKLYLYDKDSLNWDDFAKELKAKGLLLSETENCIYLGQYPAATAWRYLNAGNYELRFKCPHHSEKAFLSYSKADRSLTGSIKHRQVKSYSDGNMKHIAARLRIQNGMLGKKCSYSDGMCDYWIELIPLKPEARTSEELALD